MLVFICVSTFDCYVENLAVFRCSNINTDLETGCFNKISHRKSLLVAVAFTTA